MQQIICDAQVAHLQQTKPKESNPHPNSPFQKYLSSNGLIPQVAVSLHDNQ
jgi:hypothetical protein